MLDEFMAAEKVVLGAPMYNFSIPSQIKAWIDIIAVLGKTFVYGVHGPQGLVGSKRVIATIARRHFYGSETAAISEHAQSYMRTVLTLIGVNKSELVVAERVAGGEQNKAKALASALDAFQQLAAGLRMRMETCEKRKPLWPSRCDRASTFTDTPANFHRVRDS